MESTVVERTVIRFQLNMPSDVRARLEEYVEAMNRRHYPAKLTMSDVVIAATIEYLREHSVPPDAAHAEAIR